MILAVCRKYLFNIFHLWCFLPCGENFHYITYLTFLFLITHYFHGRRNDFSEYWVGSWKWECVIPSLWAFFSSLLGAAHRDHIIALLLHAINVTTCLSWKKKKILGCPHWLIPMGKNEEASPPNTGFVYLPTLPPRYHNA